MPGDPHLTVTMFNLPKVKKQPLVPTIKPPIARAKTSIGQRRQSLPQYFAGVPRSQHQPSPRFVKPASRGAASATPSPRFKKSSPRASASATPSPRFLKPGPRYSGAPSMSPRPPPTPQRAATRLFSSYSVQKYIYRILELQQDHPVVSPRCPGLLPDQQ